MDLALARKSGQELHNTYTITNSPALAQLRKFFCAAVRDLTSAYENRAAARVEADPQPSICDQMRRDMTQNSQEYTDPTDMDPASDIPVVESLSPLIISSATPPPVGDTPFRSITPNNHSLTYLQSGPFDLPQSYVPLARGAVSSVSLASTDLLYYVEPLPLDQLVCHCADTVRSWPAAAHDELLAVTHRDMAVARKNMADLTLYLDMQSAHLAACAGAMDNSIPLMSAETFPRASGGIRSVFDEAQQGQ